MPTPDGSEGRALSLLRPLVSFCFDDFPRSALLEGGRVLDAVGVRATYYAAMCFLNEPTDFGDGFTVADLTLASLVAPVVAPEQFPYPQPQRGHPLVEPLREALGAAGLVDWTRDMYAHHRGRSAEIASGRRF